MTREEFTELLDQKGYSYTVKNGAVVVTHRGYVCLDSLETIPEGVVFKNSGTVYLNSLETLPVGVTFKNGGTVYLNSLETLPVGVTFKNGGGVYLDSLETLPDGVVFKNSGGVYLYSLETLPKGVVFKNEGFVCLDSLKTLAGDVVFKNEGPVYLNSLTTLSDGVVFKNEGYVDLQSLTGEHKYRGKNRQFQTIDGYTMLIERSRSYGEYTVHNARYFGGGEISKLRKFYVAQSGDTYAHGDTVKSAVDDLAYKMAEHADKDEIARKVVQSQKVTLDDFHALTGACHEGTREHLSRQGIDLDEINEMSLADALKAMAGTSYGDTFNGFVETAK